MRRIACVQTGLLHVYFDSPANEEAAEYQWVQNVNLEERDNHMALAETHALILPLLTQTR